MKLKSLMESNIFLHQEKLDDLLQPAEIFHGLFSFFYIAIVFRTN